MVLIRDLSVVLVVRTYLRCHKVIHLRLHHPCPLLTATVIFRFTVVSLLLILYRSILIGASWLSFHCRRSRWHHRRSGGGEGNTLYGDRQQRPTTNVRHILLSRLLRMWSADGEGEKSNHRWGGTHQWGKLRMPFHAIVSEKLRAGDGYGVFIILS